MNVGAIYPPLNVNSSGNEENSATKYFSLYVLFSGIVGGVLLLATLFVFCKYCRGKSQQRDVFTESNQWIREDAKHYKSLLPVTYKTDAETTITRAHYRERSDVSILKRGSLEVHYSPALYAINTDEAKREQDCDGTNEDPGPKSKQPAVFLQIHISASCREPLPPGWSGMDNDQTADCKVNVEVHPGPLTPLGETDSSPSPLGTLAGSDMRRLLAIQGPTALPRVGSEWVKDSVLSLAENRTPSTDWTMLESNLDFWRREHSRTTSLNAEDDDTCSKVRYNDMGSLEQVNVEHLVDYFIEDEEEIDEMNESERDNLRLQYRRLWELRATLEEDEELTDPVRAKKKLNQQKESTKKTPAPTQKQKSLPRDVIYQEQKQKQKQQQHSLQEESQTQMKSSPDQSPEVEVITSHTTSFESNTEPCTDDVATWNLLPLPSYESRRQSYKNILSWRLRRMEAKGVRQASQEDTSFDSMDTEGSSTDASRLEQLTTSFESTTDNTDSTGAADGQCHSLQKLRADSGYRSIENPAPNPKTLRHLPIGDSAEHDGPLRLLSPEESDRESLIKFARKHPINLDAEMDDRAPHKHPSLGDSVEIETPSVSATKREEDRPRKATESITLDEGIAELEPTSWEGRRRSCGRSASKKRRQFGRSVVGVDNPVLHRRCNSLRNTCSSAYARDYSVDERSDALFREFSRCEPWSVDPLPRQRLVHGTSVHQRLQPTPARHSTHLQTSPLDIIHKGALSSRNIEDVSSVGYVVEDLRLHPIEGIRVGNKSSD